MSPLIPTRRVEEFANAADGRAPARSADVLALVELVGAVRSVDAPAPRAGFVAQLREELMAHAPGELSPEPRRTPAARPGRRPLLVQPPIGRRFAVAASAFVIAGGGVGLVATSAAALPGEMLYPVKRAGERAPFLLHTDPGDDARLMLDHAHTRLDEVAGLLSSPATPGDRDALVSATLADFTDDAVAGGKILLGSYERTGSPADIEDLRSFTDLAASALEQLAPALPAGSSQAYADAAAAVGALDLRAVAACPTCRGGEPPVRPLTTAVEKTRRLVDTTARPGGSETPAGERVVAQPQREAELDRGSDDGAPRGAGDQGGTSDPGDPGVSAPDAELPDVSEQSPPSSDDTAPPSVPDSGDTPVAVVEDLVNGGGGSNDTGAGEGVPDDPQTDVLEAPDLP